MDIEKLIERLREHRIIYKTNYDEFSGGACTGDCADAADIISTLQAENEKLRAELDDLRIQWDMYGGDVGITAVYKELEQVKRALAMMWFAYVNSDKETPHSYETEALKEAEHVLGPWPECMPKYLRRGPEE